MSIFLNIILITQKTADALRDEGRQYFKSCEYKNAIESYIRAIICYQVVGSAKWAGRTWSDLSLIFLKLEKLEESLECAKIAVCLCPEYCKVSKNQRFSTILTDTAFTVSRHITTEPKLMRMLESINAVLMTILHTMR